jgi:cell division protein FtsN
MSGRKREYYPSYYRDKRKRERTVLVLSTVIIALVGIGLLVLAGVYLLRPRENLDQLAQRRDEIVGTAPSTQTASGLPKPTATPVKVEEEQLLKPEDVTEVGSSVPEMSLAPVQFSGEEPAPDAPPPPQMTPEKSADNGNEAVPALPADENAKPGAETAPEKPKAAEEKPKPKPEEKPKAKPEEKKETPKKPAPKKPEPKPAEPAYKYNVYAGLYTSESEANKQKSRLVEMGLQSSIIARNQGDGKSYLVAVGSALENYDQAVSLKNKLREAGFGGAYILRRET